MEGEGMGVAEDESLLCTFGCEEEKGGQLLV